MLNWTNKGKALMIHLPIVLHPELAGEWESKTTTWLMEPASVYLLDFMQTTNVKSTALRLLLNFCQSAERNGKQVVSINLRPELAHRLRSLGLERRLCFVATEAEALARGEAPQKAIASPAFLNAFVAATQKVMEEQASTPCSSLKPLVLKHGEAAPTEAVAIAGLISVNSAKFRGTVAISFPKKVFLKVYSNMLGEKHEEITDEIKDAAAELINIIYGTVKTQMNKGKSIELPSAIPTVVSGENISVRTTAMVPALVVPFQMAVGNFQIEITLETAAA